MQAERQPQELGYLPLGLVGGVLWASWGKVRGVHSNGKRKFSKLLGSFVFRRAKKKTLQAGENVNHKGCWRNPIGNLIGLNGAVIPGMHLPEELMFVPGTGRLLGHIKWMLRQLNPGVVGLNSPPAGSQTTLGTAKTYSTGTTPVLCVAFPKSPVLFEQVLHMWDVG